MDTQSQPIHKASSKARVISGLLLSLSSGLAAVAQTVPSTPAAEMPAASAPGVPLTLSSAIAMALKNNRRLLLARDSVQDSREQKRIAEAHLYPILKNQSAVLYITQLEGITIPAGALAPGGPIGPLPQANITIAQGSEASYTSGTELAQPLTQLFRVRSEIRAADADLRTAKIQAADADDVVALQVRQLYYAVLVEQMRYGAAKSAVDAAVLAEQETRRSVEEGRLLEDAELASRTDLLEKKQAVLTSRLNKDDLTLRLDDVIGLPLGTTILLDQREPGPTPVLPTRAEALALALNRNATVLAAKESVLKAKAGISAVRTTYIPDITGIARYSYQSGVPFLRHNFGTFGGIVSWDLFDGGAREARLREARLKLLMAQTQLQQSESDVQIQIAAAYDKLEQLEQLVDVSTQASAAREESLRIQTRRAELDAELASGVAAASAASASARVNVLNSQLSLSLAQNDIKKLLGEHPE